MLLYVVFFKLRSFKMRMKYSAKFFHLFSNSYINAIKFRVGLVEGTLAFHPRVVGSKPGRASINFSIRKNVITH